MTKYVEAHADYRSSAPNRLIHFFQRQTDGCIQGFLSHRARHSEGQRQLRRRRPRRNQCFPRPATCWLAGFSRRLLHAPVLNSCPRGAFPGHEARRSARSIGQEEACRPAERHRPGRAVAHLQGIPQIGRRKSRGRKPEREAALPRPRAARRLDIV